VESDRHRDRHGEPPGTGGKAGPSPRQRQAGSHRRAERSAPREEQVAARQRDVLQVAERRRREHAPAVRVSPGDPLPVLGEQIDALAPGSVGDRQDPRAGRDRDPETGLRDEAEPGTPGARLPAPGDQGEQEDNGHHDVAAVHLVLRRHRGRSRRAEQRVVEPPLAVEHAQQREVRRGEPEQRRHVEVAELREIDHRKAQRDQRRSQKRRLRIHQLPRSPPGEEDGRHAHQQAHRPRHQEPDVHDLVLVGRPGGVAVDRQHGPVERRQEPVLEGWVLVGPAVAEASPHRLEDDVRRDLVVVPAARRRKVPGDPDAEQERREQEHRRRAGELRAARPVS